MSPTCEPRLGKQLYCRHSCFLLFRSFVHLQNIYTRFESAYREEDIEELVVEGFAYNASKGVDMLLTAEWGEGFHHLLPKQVATVQSGKAQQKWGGRSHPLKSFKQLSPAVRRVCSEGNGGVKAQYHFAGTEGQYFMLPPYAHAPPPLDAEKAKELGAASGANESAAPALVTRFYGLGSVGEKEGGKSIMALNVNPPPPPSASMGVKKAAKEGETRT